MEREKKAGRKTARGRNRRAAPRRDSFTYIDLLRRGARLYLRERGVLSQHYIRARWITI